MWASFSLADDFSQFNKATGQWEDKGTVWWDCVAFKSVAEGVVDRLHKGSLVLVEGTTQPKPDWTGRDGTVHTNQITVIANTVAEVARKIKEFTPTTTDNAVAENPEETTPLETASWGDDIPF